MISESASKDSSKLAMAAEELIKAACSHVESTSLTIGKETVEGLKKLSIGSSSIEKSVESLKTSMDSKLNTLNQSISNLKEEVVPLLFKRRIKSCNGQSKTLRIIIFLRLIFQKFEKKDDRRVEFTSFVKTILLSFRKGTGHDITNRSCQPYHYRNDTKNGEKHFRDELSKHIHELLGHEPRIALGDNGYEIYYC